MQQHAEGAAKPPRIKLAMLCRRPLPSRTLDDRRHPTCQEATKAWAHTLNELVEETSESDTRLVDNKQRLVSYSARLCHAWLTATVENVKTRGVLSGDAGRLMAALCADESLWLMRRLCG